MKILKGNYGECRFCDNMDETHGLPSLAEKSWDLCLTDPPYMINWTGEGRQKRKTITYEDKKFDNNIWYREILKCGKRLVFSPGIMNLREWFIRDEFGIVIWHNPEKQGSSIAAKMSKFEPFLCKNLKHPLKFTLGIFKYFNEGSHGFFNRAGMITLHPCPKPTTVFRHIISELEPTSVIDPFLGSGTTAEVCESLGIPWLGYEIMEEYAPDIEKRIKRGIKKKQQESLEAFL